MSENKDNVSLLYNGLIKKGYTQEDLGDEATFRRKMSDENSRKELYDYVSGRGDFRIGDYNTYESRLKDSYATEPVKGYTVDNIVTGGVGTQEEADSLFDENVRKRKQKQIADEEADIDKYYTSKPMNTAKDVYDNFRARFSNTKRGIELGDELARKTDEVQNKYLKEYLASDNYKKLVATYKGDELVKQANEQFNMKYGGAINDELLPYQKAYNDEVNIRYGSQMDKELKRINKDDAGTHARELMTSIDSELEDIDERIAKRKKVVRNDNFRNRPGMPSQHREILSGRNDKELAELRGERTYLEGAKDLIEDSQNILKAVDAEKDGTFFGGLWRGFRDKVFDIDTWTMGLSDLVGGMRLKSVLEKAEKGDSLTTAEETLLDASLNNMAVNYYYRSDLGRGYKAGEMTGESLPFMLEFIVNPVSTSGNAIAGRLLNYGLKKYAKNKVAQGAARFVGDAIAAAGMTATTGLPGVLGEAVERTNRNYEYGFDEDGNLNVKKTGDESFGHALGMSATTRLLENQSEMIFNAFNGASKMLQGVEQYIPGGVNAFMNKIKNSRVGEVWRDIKNNPTMRELAERTQFHGIGEEYLEEVYNNFANVALGEMTYEEAIDLNNNIDTFLGLAPTSVAFGAIGAAGMATERYKNRRELERVFGRMTDEQKKKLEELQRMGKMSTNKDIAVFLSETIKDESLTPEQKRNEIEYAYDLAKQNAIDEITETDIQDKVADDNAIIDSVTDPSTGLYTEVDRLVLDEKGETIRQHGYVVGWLGQGESRTPIFLPEGVENSQENRIPLKPTEWDKESLRELQNGRVKEINEEMTREEAAVQAENESKYAPEVLSAQMQQGVPFNTPTSQIVPVAPMPEGNGWIVEEYAMDENGELSKNVNVRELTNDEYRDMLQAQLDAEQAAVEELSKQDEVDMGEPVGEQVNGEVNDGVNTEVDNPMENVESSPMSPIETQGSSPMSPMSSPISEEKSTQSVIPTKEDGSIDFVAYGKEGSLRALGEKYGEKMPNKVAVTAKALADDLKKAQQKLDKAEEAYDNAPIGREEKADNARMKAREEYEAVKREADFWAEMDAEIKDAQKRREELLNPTVESSMTGEPASADEFIAQQLASGNIVLNNDDYMRETGYGSEEANAMNGGTQKLLSDNGMTIEAAGERLMEMDRENGTNYFDQTDANAGRDALLSVLGSVRSRKELNQYITENRKAQAKKDAEGLRNAAERQVMDAHFSSLEDYVLQMEAAEMENPFENIDVEQIDAIFAELEEEYQNFINNGQGRTNEVAEGSDSVLPSEQTNDTGGIGGIESKGNSERNGVRTPEEGEGTHVGQQRNEVKLEQKEGETTLQFAERVAEENRRRPLRQRANEWAKALGVKVTFLESIDDVDARTRAQIEEAHAEGSGVPGWVASNGEVYFFMPDLRGLKDVDDTYVHEVVAHIGIPAILGKGRFNELCDKVWDMMPQSDKDYYEKEYPGVKEIKDDTIRHRRAADEYIAKLAEKQDLTPEEKTIWDNIVKMFRELLDKALNGIIGKSKLTDADIAELIKASYANLKSGASENVGGEGTRFRTLEQINNTFNEELQQQIDGILPKGHIYQLGSPSAVLLSTGIADVPIELNSTRLEDKSKNFGHDYNLSELKDLVNAIHNPLAVFAYGDKNKAQNIIAEIQHEGKNFIVGLSIKPSVGGKVLNINSIRNVFPKDNAEWLNWISQGKMLYADKERIQNLINQQRTNLADVDYLDLDSIANIIKDFQNPTQPEEKSRFRVVYHGSGASFDRFDHNFMSTGEGNQSYGWGTYLTDVESIGKQYASIYAKNSPLAANALRWIEENSTYEDFLAQGEGKRRNWAIRHAKDYLKELKEEGASEEVIKAYEQDLVDAENALSEENYNRTRENMVASLNRNLYEVEIPENDGTNYLEWDKPLSEENKKRIKDAVLNSQMYKDYAAKYGEDISLERLNSWMNAFDAGRVYRLLENFADNEDSKESAKQISMLLSDAGYTGFEYPSNSMSGGNENGDKNYVIFNEDDLNIVEHTRFRAVKDKNELVAVHNISEENLRKVLKVGGLIMPSIAITKADMGHEGYGDISLLFDKETINPSDRRNKVYGGDAWTPRFPQMVPKINDKVSTNVRNKIRGLITDRTLSENYSLSAELHPDNIERTISDRGVEGYYNKEWMKLAYLLDNGKKVKIPMKMKDYGDMSETIIEMAKERGLKVFEIQQNGYDFYNNNKDFVESIKNIVDERKLSSLPEDKRDVARKLFGEKEMRFAYFDTLISAATKMEYDLEHGGLKEIIDRPALRESIEKKVKTNNADYNKWVDNLFDGIVEKYGIRNDRDWYTPSGNLRPWGQLYDDATPANILRHMLTENEQGGSGNFFNSNIMGASAETYESIEEIREKGKKRLRRLDEGEYDEWSNSVSERMSEICNDFLSEKQRNEFGASIDAKIDITNAVAKDKTAKGIYKTMKRDYPGFTMGHAKKIEEIVKEIQDFAIGYFEAKPRRIVPLNEVRKAIVPSNTSSDILEGLKDNGIDVATYRKGNEASRSRLINKESNGIRFRVSNLNQEVFVSNAQKAVEGIKQEKGTPQQWLAMIEKNSGLKAGEDKWLGLSDWLKGLDKKSVTKAEILDFINQNKIRIEEVKYSGSGMYDEWYEDDVYDAVSNAVAESHGVEFRDEFMKAFVFEYDDYAERIRSDINIEEAAAPLYSRYNDDVIEVDSYGELTRRESNKIREWADRIVSDSMAPKNQSDKPINSTRLSYTTEGLENKQEIALVVPTIEPWNESDEIHFGDAGEGRAVAWIRFGETTTPNVAFINAREAVNDYIAEMREKYNVKGGGIYDVMNEDEVKHLQELTSAEFDTRDKAERVLVIDEIQSKRHQEGREKGYKKDVEIELGKWTTTNKAGHKTLISEVPVAEVKIKGSDEVIAHIVHDNRGVSAYYVVTPNNTSTAYKNEEDALSIAERMVNKQEGKIPEAPFEKNWHELAMKRMLRYAAENGYDKVAWTTGAQQAERYGIGGVVSSISKGRKRGDNTLIQLEYNNGKRDSWVVDPEGRVVDGGVANGETLGDIIGKELAVKVMSLNEGEEISGEGLRVGGEGMKGFYDKMLPSFVNKYVKKWGTKVQDIELPNVEEAGRTMHSVEVTDAMKESVMEGQTMFRVKREDAQKQVDNFTSKYNSKPVAVVEAAMSDEELSEAFNGQFEVDDIRDFMNKSKSIGGFIRNLNKVVIFADKMKWKRMEESLFHENIHALINEGDYTKLLAQLYEYAKDDEAFSRWRKISENSEYKPYERAEEFFAYVVSNGMVANNLEDVLKHLDSERQSELNELLNKIGYDYDIRRRSNGQSVDGRTAEGLAEESAVSGNASEESGRRTEGKRRTSGGSYEKIEGLRPEGSGVQEVDERTGRETDESGTSEGVQGGRLEESGSIEGAERDDARTKEQAERLGQLFERVANEGLRGVVGDAAYDLAMINIYHALPESERVEVSMNAVRNLGGNVAAAVDEYLDEKGNPSLWEKVVGVFRDMFRKAGFDIELNGNDVKYLLWRSKKPLDRNNLVEVAEDIDKKYNLGVGEYEDSPVRFRVSNKLNIRDEYEATIKKGGYQAREALQDAMLSLRRTQELIEKASGNKLRDFENAWMHENRLSSTVQAEIHEMERKFYKPMIDAVKNLMEASGMKEFEVADYLMLKHGIERNREMAVRKALTDSEGKIDRQKLESWYQDKRNVRYNRPELDTWRKQQEELDNIALLYGADMSVDYSGLTSMFDTDDLADCTERAYNEVEALENLRPVETETLGKAVKAMTQSTLDKSFESGLMDRKVYDELSNDMYDYYVPLRGFDETTSDEVYAYMDNERGAFNAPLRRAKGRTSKSDNPIAYMKSIAESGIMQGERNKMKQTFLNMVINRPSDLVSVKEGVWAVFNPATGEWEAASFPESSVPRNATPADVEAAYEQWEDDMEQQAQLDPSRVKKIREADDVPYRVIGNRINQHQVIVKRLGKSYTLTVNGNPRLAMALNGQTNPNNTSNDGKVSEFVSNKINAINRQLSAWYTTRNPDFVASNFMRDTVYTNTIVRAKEGNAYANKFHAHYAKLLMPGKMMSLFSKYENGTLDSSKPIERDFIEFMMNGGETGYSNLKDLENIKKQIEKELKGSRLQKVENLLERLDIVNRAVENIARFAAYRTSRQQGRTVARSIYDAKEISVNFNRKGAGGTFFGMTGQTGLGNLASAVGAGGRAFYVFFNAAIQGTTNLMHVARVNPKGTASGIAAMFLMGAIIPMLLGGDDEKDYYDLPEHVRMNHLVLPGTGDAWVSIPLPIEYRIMYGMGELLTSWRTGHERGEDIARKMLSLTGQALPLNFLEEGLDAFIPSVVSPLWQAYTNENWTGLPIYKDNEFNKNDPEYTKAYNNTDRNLVKFTKALYEWTFDEENQREGIDLNPAIIETIARGYFSGAFTTMSNLSKTLGTIQGEREFDWRNIPVANRIFKTGDERTKEKRITNEYFSNMEKLEFMQSRERMLNKIINNPDVSESEKDKARLDREIMQGSDIYKQFTEFNKKKKEVDKLRKKMKEKGSDEESEKKLSRLQDEANKALK